MKISSFKLNLNAAEDGVLFPMDGDENAKVRVARWLNKKHTKFIIEFSKQNDKKLKAGIITKEQYDFKRAEMWPTILTDLIGFTEDDGSEFKYSQQAIIDMARNAQFQEFFEKIAIIAQEEKNYRVDTIKELGESSPDSSLGQ